MTTTTQGHTPGPWSADVPPSSMLTTRWIRSESGESVALVGYRDFSAGQEADLANARLIAAAPEMLEALRELHDWMREHATVAESLEMLTRSHNVIAKATNAA